MICMLNSRFKKKNSVYVVLNFLQKQLLKIILEKSPLPALSSHIPKSNISICVNIVFYHFYSA